MDWTNLKNNVYYSDGSLRDIYIMQTDRQDSKNWVNYVNENHRIEFYNGLAEVTESKIDFSIIEKFWSGNQVPLSTARVFIDKIQINNHFFIESEIENDIDPREFNSIEDHEKLMIYMSDLSKLTNKPVILTPENESETILIKVEKEQIEISKIIEINE